MSFNKNTGMYEGYIYLITNKVNGKQYVGQTSKTIEKRWKQHLSHSRYEQNYLYYAMRKYGTDNFDIKELDKIECSNSKELNDLLNKIEIRYISKYDTYENGYNLTIGGGNSSKNCKTPVDVYDLSGNLINSFERSIEAATYYDVSIGAISSVCHGKNHTLKNLVFRIKGESFDKYSIEYKTNSKMVYQFDKEYNLISSYKNASIASKSISENAYGETIQNAIRNGHLAYGYYWSYSERINTNKIKKKYRIQIAQYDLKGNLINIFSSILEASFYLNGEKIRNQHQQNCYNGIKNATIGKQKTCRGYIWRELTDSFDTFETNILHKIRAVNKYTKDNIFIETFDTITNAVNSVNKDSTSAISRCCKGKLNSAYGYKWFYADDPNQPDKSRLIL